ncbi:MAG: ABC transporter ATP-binding protein [Gammaproteobacteria bacterium]
MATSTTTPPSFFRLFRQLLAPERRFYWLMLVYALAISGLTLSVPLSVQVLISTVANAALVRQVVVLALMLFGLLMVSVLFAAIQHYLMELFERRFFSRILSEATLRLIYARYLYMEALNRDDLVNRYFDIMTVQKSLPPLLAGSLAFTLQALVGIVVTSLYHPVFMIFNIAVVLFAWLTFRLFDRGASLSSVALSETKYAAANWLESLSRANSFFKSRRTIEFALERSLNVRADYVVQHKRHFRYTFAQVLGFLFMYAANSAILLGVGGWLVVIGQLTIGQLVAAELILSAIFYGISRLGYYLELYYDLYAALNKLTQLFQLPFEDVERPGRVGDWAPAVHFDDVRKALPGLRFAYDFELPAGSSTLVDARSGTQVKTFCDLLLHFDVADSGHVYLGGNEVGDFDPHALRDQVHVIDSTLFPECSIGEFLAIAAPEMPRAAMRDLLGVVGLDREMKALRGDLDQVLTPYGSPLTVSGVIKLKIAFALASRPKVLVLTPLFDMISKEARASIVAYLREHGETTAVVFSHRHDLTQMDSYMFWDFDRQYRFASYEALAEAIDAAGKAP